MNLSLRQRANSAQAENGRGIIIIIIIIIMIIIIIIMIIIIMIMIIIIITIIQVEEAVIGGLRPAVIYQVKNCKRPVSQRRNTVDNVMRGSSLFHTVWRVIVTEMKKKTSVF